MKITGILLLFLSLLVACSEERDHKGKIPLVEISGEVLFLDDLQAVLPVSLSSEDSILFAENYIQGWAKDILLFNLAELNVPDSELINRLTENYRRSLIVHAYQQALIEQSLPAKLDEEEMIEFYNANKELFVLTQPLIKGLFIKVPLISPGLNNVRKWYKVNNEENVEALEKYSLNNAVSYEYFYDKWLFAIDVMDKIPVQIIDLNTFLKENKYIEIKDEEFVYFLHIEQLLEEGKQKPYEFAQKEIKGLLANQKRVQYINEIKDELYRNAVNGKRITYYY